MLGRKGIYNSSPVARLKSERIKAPSVDVGNTDEYDDFGIKSATQKTGFWQKCFFPLLCFW